MSHSADVRIWFDADQRYDVAATSHDCFFVRQGDPVPPVGIEGVLTMTVDGRPHTWRLRVIEVTGNEVRTENV